jgi:AraC family ethanolamine operon transcriptional activator
MHQRDHQPSAEPASSPTWATASDATSTELRAEFDDVEHLCASIRDWDIDFRPLVLDAPPGRVASVVQQGFGDLAISHARFRTSLDQLGAPPPGTLTFAVLGAGMRRLWWRGMDLDADHVLSFPVGAELRSTSGPDFEVHTVSVPKDRVAQLAECFRLPLPTPSQRMETYRPGSGVLSALRGGLTALKQGRAGNRELDSANIADALVLSWLRAHKPPPRTERNGNARQRDRALRACLARLEHPDWAECSQSQLCDVGGVGERTLQYAFRERFGLTPAAFLKARRLAAVRSALHRAEPEQSVADIAAGYGFWHTGQFAADYRRAFGEAPSSALGRTVARGS